MALQLNFLGLLIVRACYIYKVNMFFETLRYSQTMNFNRKILVKSRKCVHESFIAILDKIWPHYARFLNGLKLEISLSRFAIKSVIFYHASHNNMS